MKIDDSIFKIVLSLVFGWIIYHLYTNMCSCQIEGMASGVNISLGVGGRLNLPSLGIQNLTLQRSSSPMFSYEISFVNNRPGKFVFKDASGESYNIFVLVNKENKIHFNSTAPTIVYASSN